MALSPREIDKQKRQKNEAGIIAAENVIDQMLIDGRHTIAESVIQRHTKCVEEVIQRYRYAGWSVQWQSDQRDGSYYEFTPRT
jgi:hypothetical protein